MDPRNSDRPPGNGGASRLPGSTGAALAAAVGLVLIAALTPNGCTVRLPHAGENQVYPLKGLHKAVPCEGCHGQYTGKPEAQSTSCKDCHTDDLPEGLHYPGQECFPCHTEDGWAVGVYDTATTPTTPTTGVEDTATVPEFVHEAFPEDQLCWDCHGIGTENDDRPLLIAGDDHWWDPNLRFSWDCGPCHSLVDWTGYTLVHQVRTPHGTYYRSSPTQPQDWVVSCEPCHTDLTDYTQFQCGTCHLEEDPLFFPHKYLLANSPEADRDCLLCHEDGDRIEQD